MTREELNQSLNAQLVEATSAVVTAVKKYVDGKDEVLKTELKDEIVKELSQIEGLGKELEKIKEMADAFAQVFDADEDGKITPEEILAKITALKANIDAVVSDLDKFKADTNDTFSALKEAIKSLTDRVSALEINVSKNADEISKIKANIETNYYTKADTEAILSINIKSIEDKVNSILFPNDEEGDGATL